MFGQTPTALDGVGTAVSGIVGDLVELITDNLPVILTAGAIVLGAVILWRLVRRFVRG